MLKIAKDLFDLLYPIGIFVETTNANWNPTNAGWYGTWTREDDGTTLVSYKSSGAFKKTIGTIVGSENHYHWLPTFDYGQGMGVLDTSQLHKRTSGITPAQDAGNWWFQKTSTTGATSGGAQWGTSDSSSIQPSKVIYRWHRTA